jgi:hypothetical protein
VGWDGDVRASGQRESERPVEQNTSGLTRERESRRREREREREKERDREKKRERESEGASEGIVGTRGIESKINITESMDRRGFERRVTRSLCTVQLMLQLY